MTPSKLPLPAIVPIRSQWSISNAPNLLILIRDTTKGLNHLRCMCIDGKRWRQVVKHCRNARIRPLRGWSYLVLWKVWIKLQYGRHISVERVIDLLFVCCSAVGQILAGTAPVSDL